MADQEKTIRDVIRAAWLKAEAERTTAEGIVLPVMTTRSAEELARDCAATVGLVVDLRTNYAQKGGGPVPLIIDLESFIRAHGPAGWRLLETAAASWVVKKAADSFWARVIAWVREVQRGHPMVQRFRLSPSTKKTGSGTTGWDRKRNLTTPSRNLRWT
jgi:hypothetical protein